MSLDNLPGEWFLTELNQVLSVKNGYAFKSKDYISEKISDELVPVIRISDIQDNSVNTLKSVYVDKLKASDNFKIEKNDLLIAMSGATTGKTGIYRDDEVAFLNQRVGNIKVHSEDYFLPKFRNFLVQKLSKKILDNAYGGAQPNISSKDIESLAFGLPPLAEQQEIVRQLDIMLVQVEQIKARLDAIPAILKKFRQSVLADAVSGKLTEEWRELNQEINNNWQPNFQVSSLSDERYIFKLPNNWVWDHLGNLIENYNHIRVPIKQGDRRDRSGQYPYYGAFGIIDHIDEYKFDGTYLLLAEDGKNLESRTRPIALIAKGKFWVNNHAHVMKAKDNISLEYLEIFLNSPLVAIDQFLTGMDQVKLNKNAMVKLPISVPSYSEQLQIVELANTYFRYSDHIEETIRSAQKRVNLLTQSILAKAFSGELTAEWREQHQELITGVNSAESLLAKIQAEREASKPVKKAKKAKTV